MFSHIPMSPRNIHFGVDLSPSLPLSVWGEGEREKEILSPNPKLGQLCLKTEVSINPISEGLKAGIVKKKDKIKTGTGNSRTTPVGQRGKLGFTSLH